MELGILGTGRMAVRLADLARRGGHSVILGSRDPARAARIAAKLDGGGQVTGGSYDDAVAAAVVMPAIFIRDGAFEALRPYAERVAGKVVVDIFNPFNDAYDDFILPWDTSAAEELQKLWPKARIVSAFKYAYWEAFENPNFEGGPMDVIYTGDDAGAKDVLKELFKASPWRFLDGGDLASARYTERMTLFLGRLSARYGFGPRLGWRVLGGPWVAGENDAYGHIIQRWDRP